MNKLLDFKTAKDSKEGVITPEAVISHLLDAIKEGKVKRVVFAVIDNDDAVRFGASSGSALESLGMLDVIKQYIISDMHDY